jgi:hypothetical protein
MRAFNLSLALLVAVAILAVAAQFAFGQSDPMADKSQDAAFQAAALSFCFGLITLVVGALIANYRYRAGTNVMIAGIILVLLAIIIYFVASLG